LDLRFISNNAIYFIINLFDLGNWRSNLILNHGVPVIIPADCRTTTWDITKILQQPGTINGFAGPVQRRMFADVVRCVWQTAHQWTHGTGSSDVYFDSWGSVSRCLSRWDLIHRRYSRYWVLILITALFRAFVKWRYCPRSKWSLHDFPVFLACTYASDRKRTTSTLLAASKNSWMNSWFSMSITNYWWHITL